MATVFPARTTSVSRAAFWDGVFVGLSIAHAAALCVAASIPVIAIGLWWNANTIAHNFIHRPFFRSRAMNAGYSAFLSLVLGIPQSLWRARHLAHHMEGHDVGRTAVASAKVVRPAAVVFESALVLALWSVLAVTVPDFLLTVYLPGYVIGLGLCFLQGHFEHARGTTSHYGRIYNALFFNDGYHVEHHRRPGVHWTELPASADTGSRTSRWPPVLRWLDVFSLESLERLVLCSTTLQRFVLRSHEQAFRVLLRSVPAIRRVTVVGGGLFPRTALILRQLLPDASIVIVDVSATHLEIARTFLDDRIEYRCERYDPAVLDTADLVVIPLAFLGDRRRVYRQPPAPVVLVHDWIAVRHVPGVDVSWLLCKRLNLVRQ